MSGPSDQLLSMDFDIPREVIDKIGENDPGFKDWQSHPFWSQSIDHGQTDNPAVAGLLAVEGEMTPQERASEYRRRGNDTIRVLQGILNKEDVPEEQKSEARERHCFNATCWYSKALDELGSEDPKESAICLANRAYCQFILGNWRNCLMDCQRALKLDAENFKALYRAGYAALRLKKGTQAVEYLTRALKLQQSKHVQAQLDLAMKALQTGEYPTE